MKTPESIEASKELSQAETGESGNSLDKTKAPWLKPYHWKPGQSGNPKGRPKDRASEIARAIFENNEEKIYEVMAKALAKGNAYAFKELAERAYGKLKEVRELTGKDGGPIETREVSDAELNERIKQLERDLGLASQIDDAGRIGVAQAGANKANGSAQD